MKGWTMEPLQRKNFVRYAAAAASISAAMLIGTLFPGNAAGRAAGSDSTYGFGAISASASISNEDVYEFIEYRKAGLDEYELPLAVTSVEEDTAEAEEVLDAVTAAAKTSKTPTPSFDVTLPSDNTFVYDPQPARLGYVTTRSTKQEYYTVNDLISGGIVTMNAHDMVCMMIYNEIGANWGVEAIKAQAVAAYTHLRFNDALGTIPTVGLKKGYPAKIENCVTAVEGQCVFYNGGIANAVYAASTGGYSCDSAKVFGVSYPYLKPVISAYDQLDPNWGTVTRFTESYIRKALENRLGFKLSDDVQNWFRVDSVFSGKYVDSLVIDGGKAKMSGQAARKLFGLKSAAFEISYANGSFSFKTYGYGHGVGMSQWGAKLYADHGYTYDQILRHYYMGTEIKLSDPSVKAVKRGGLTDAQIKSQISESSIAGADGFNSDPTEDIIIDKEAVNKAEAQPAVTTAAETAKTEVKTPEPAEDETPPAAVTTTRPEEVPPPEVEEPQVTAVTEPEAADETEAAVEDTAE